jgi:uncharacterized membrane protein YhaH (DUF805 family)
MSTALAGASSDASSSPGLALTKHVDGKRRASRTEYWYFALFSLHVGIATGGVGWIVLIVYAVRPGEPHTNVYG